LALTPAGPNAAIWIHDLRSHTKTRLTFSPGQNSALAWSQEGTRIALANLRPNEDVPRLFVKDASGAGQEQPVPTSDLIIGMPYPPFDWSPDGKYLPVVNGKSGGPVDVWQVRVDGSEKPRRLVETDALAPVYSPDGKWLAYTSFDSGRNEVYVIALIGRGGKWQLSTSGGRGARWPRRSHEILYIAADGGITAVPVDLRGGHLELGKPHTLFRANVNPNQPGFDVSADGKLILLTPLPSATISRLELIVNWIKELPP
jgi:Tol biopolymer transport system component